METATPIKPPIPISFRSNRTTKGPNDASTSLIEGVKFKKNLHVYPIQLFKKNLTCRINCLIITPKALRVTLLLMGATIELSHGIIVYLMNNNNF